MDARFARQSTEQLWKDHSKRVHDPMVLGIRFNNQAEHFIDAGRTELAVVYALAGLACQEMDTRRIEAEHKAMQTATN